VSEQLKIEVVFNPQEVRMLELAADITGGGIKPEIIAEKMKFHLLNNARLNVDYFMRHVCRPKRLPTPIEEEERLTQEIDRNLHKNEGLREKLNELKRLRIRAVPKGGK